MTAVLPIVEGEGDEAAVPALIRRIAHDHSLFDVQVMKPQRRGDLPKIRGNLASFLQTAALEGAPIFWVLDYDSDGCNDVERDLAELNLQASRTRIDQPVSFAFMVKEFESLFLADHETTCSVFVDIPANIKWPDDPESVRGAKEWLSTARPKGSAYKPTSHQAKLTSRLDLQRLRERSKSFVRFENSLLSLLNA